MKRTCLTCFLLAAIGCSEDPTLFVDLITDMVPGAEFTGVVVRVNGVEQDRVARLDMNYTLGERIARFDVPQGTNTGVLELVDAQGVVLSREFVVEVKGTEHTTTLVLSRDCRGVMCPGSGSPLATACLFSSRSRFSSPSLWVTQTKPAPAFCHRRSSLKNWFLACSSAFTRSRPNTVSAVNVR